MALISFEDIGHEKVHSYSSTQFDLNGELKDIILRMAYRIPDEDLAADGREEHSHITCKYGLHTNDVDEVRNIVSGFGPVPLRLMNVSCFPAENTEMQRGGADLADVIKIDVLSSRLHQLNKLISDNLECTDTFPTYKPHCTLAYLKPGMGEFYVGSLGIRIKEFALTELTFSDQYGNVHLLDLCDGIRMSGKVRS